MRITVLRLGHRVARDKRITTHVALVARAFGASEIVLTEEDKRIEETIKKVNENFGGDFKIFYEKNWKKMIKEKKKNSVIVHLTMYGMPIEEKIEEIRKKCEKEKKGIVVIVGAEKVPGEVYKLADYNIAILNQPHSEVSALAIFLDRFFKGKEFELAEKFKGKLKIKPSERGKKVETAEN